MHQALIALGWVGEADYVRELAMICGAEAAEDRQLRQTGNAANPAVIGVHDAALGAGQAAIAIDALAFAPDVVAALAQEARSRGLRVFLATRDKMAEVQLGPFRRLMLDDAISGLGQFDPMLSAKQPAARWQKLALPAVLVAGLAGSFIAADIMIPLVLLLLAIPLLCAAVIRLVGLAALLKARQQRPLNEPPLHRAAKAPLRPTRQADAALPVYSILIPLYDEADVLPRLVRQLSSLDYPAGLLDILLVLEEADTATRAAAAAIDLPGNFRTIVVPAGGPRTKPKALNFALQLVRGSFLVVYDAEDRPDAGQLREALDRFAGAGPELACVQAHLNTYNPDAGFLTRQFSLEYSVLFDAILPGLERLGLPLPLGGTSNHFRISALRAAGAWDPYNVTEDADLGIRLARLGLRTATITSTTWEEAPEDFGNWWRQRTRWLKGWMQTYLVHMRRPRRLYRELGMFQFLGLQVLMGGILVSVLAHPLIYALVGYELWSGQFMAAPESTVEAWLLGLALVNFGLGLASSIGVGVIAVVVRGRWWLAPHAILMPVYWLLISAAGYRALIQLVRQPFLWEKTRHGQTRHDQAAEGRRIK